ncbi:MAG: biopolymer transporter ExbD [Kiritimatiellae bacterium]|jgi:biopolymer transport protein ExbD|nr:biopolymer transporter ExbD [Kiritimatiellia bacterium]
MSRRNRHSSRIGGSKASIDMNSLIDLTFLLLVTFMLTIPALEQGVSIMLPRAKTDTLPTKNAKANVITVDVNHRVFMNNVPITLEDLRKDLQAKVAADPDVPVHVRGDERLEYGAVMEVVKIVYDCHVRKMAIVTQEK